MLRECLCLLSVVLFLPIWEEDVTEVVVERQAHCAGNEGLQQR